LAAPGSLLSAIERRLGVAIVSSRPVAGGDINDAYALEAADGRALFVKTRAEAGTGEFEAEAAGLRWLGEGGAPVPETIAVGPAGGEDDPGTPYLALRWIEPGRLSANGARELGRALARLHRSGAPAHGSSPAPGPLRFGSVELEARPGDSWAEVYAEQRLAPLMAMAGATGSLDPAGERAVAAVCERIDELGGPAEPPARLHGDLWGGNVHADEHGRGWLVDPAAHGGHREMDLAMLELFGSPAAGILEAYCEAYPPAEGWRERIALWQLQPLLVHAVLFGGGYGSAAARAAEVYL
jgi:fructosamine-3-kinase